MYVRGAVSVPGQGGGEECEGVRLQAQGRGRSRRQGVLREDRRGGEGQEGRRTRPHHTHTYHIHTYIHTYIHITYTIQYNAWNRYID